MKIIDYYIDVFQNLRRDYSFGGAPHKPILLLALIKSFDTGVYFSNRITISPELVGYYKDYWKALVTTPHKESFALPFYHLDTRKPDSFWKLVAKPGYEFALTLSKSIKSFSALTEALDYVILDENLVLLLKDKIYRKILTEALLTKYFSQPGLFQFENIKTNYYQWNCFVSKHAPCVRPWSDFHRY